MKKLSRRDFLKTAGMSVTGLALAACAPKGVEPTDEPVAASTAEPVVATNTPSAPKEVTLEIYDYDPTGTDYWVQADKNFDVYFSEKYPHIKVNRTLSPWGGYTEKFLTSVAGGAKFDVIYGWGGWRSIFIENNAIQPIDDVVAADPTMNLDDFFDSAKEIVDGKLYGISWAHMPDFIWYNKTKVLEAGTPDPKTLSMNGQWNWDALYTFAKALSKKTADGPTYGFSFVEMGTGYALSTYSVMLASLGGKMWSDDFKQSLMNSPENVQFFTYMQKFFNEGLSPTPGSGGGLDPNVGFPGQRVTGFITGPWTNRTASQEKWTDNFDIGFAALPQSTAGMFHTVYLNSYYLGRDTDKQEAAWTWYKERSFSDAANTFYLPVGTGRFPVRKDVAPQSEYAWEDTEIYNLIRPTMVSYASSPKESEFGALFKTAFDEMVLGMRPIQEILDQLAADGTALVAG